MNQLFFELLRIALGHEGTLSRTPSAEEWQTLMELSKRQSLTGLIHSSLQSLRQRGVPEIQNLTEHFYLTWTASAATISETNKRIAAQSAWLCQHLRKDGFESCIFKGQSVARYYPSHLSALRQSGDIDVWLWPIGDWSLSHDERMNRIVRYARSTARCNEPTYHNISIHAMSDISIELHYTLSWMFSLPRNRRLQRWIEAQAPQMLTNPVTLLGNKPAYAPTVEFDAVIILLHIYRHLLGEGVGLRQVVDYYHVLRALKDSGSGLSPESQRLMQELGLWRFASAIMWILHSVLGLEEEYLLCLPNQKEGQFLLSEIMLAGNFGHYDERIDRSHSKSVLGTGLMRIRRNLHFLTHYPSEVLWCPVWKVWHWNWRRKV